ncbi:ABC transporter permease [Paracoccus sp. MBLB3053]|uniref:Transport permease protein n=1 Tax=Paracoccus aurantius TaxID=3073814 RepID=A0ABU2HWL4_9RHOB|nr:ABC transporter permease [Paracoccus sp. MBLB3053]MDS9469447.1 ABC transporter permease [Paracoccus sp. MBLB3053]
MKVPRFTGRLVALTRKETRQMLRDRSNLFVGLLLPLALIMLFGFGLSFDVTNARLAVVVQDNTPSVRDFVARLYGSEYLAPSRVFSTHEAENLMRAGRVDAILTIPADFSADLAQGGARLQLLLNGVDSNSASSIEGYVSAAIAVQGALELDRAGNNRTTTGGIVITQRTWFNEAGESTWFLVPGLIVLIMTLIGAFLTSLLVAREWERGTLEALFVTPVAPIELVLSKLAPYLVIGFVDLVMCLLAARWLFHVPMRGSLVVILLVSLLYLLVSLLIGLLISATTRNQFAASQMALLLSFMPALMLSGFVFDLRNVPVAVQLVSQILPATHFMGLIKTLFMAGNNWPETFRTSAILGGYAFIMLLATRRALRKRLE